MIKSVLLHVGLFLLPSAFFLAWLFVFRRQAVAAFTSLRLPEGPWVWLLMGGFVLVAASLVFLGLTTGFDVEATYSPARYEEGAFIPGKTE